MAEQTSPTGLAGLAKGQPFEPAAHLFDDCVPLPAAILLESAIEHNIELMMRYCQSHSVSLAPHGKTTMCAELIQRQLAAGAWAITVATAWQASMVAEMGVNRILLANELVDQGSIRLIERLLAERPELEFYCYVDSFAGHDLLTQQLTANLAGRLKVLVELGVPAGRTGLRTDDTALELARQVSAGPLPLAGFAAFEGIIDGGSLDQTVRLVDELIERLHALAIAAEAEQLYASTQPIVSVGGSAYFDRVVRRLPASLNPRGFRVVLRSGCYVTHDCGSYQALSPLGARSTGGERLRPAIEVWAVVLSRPEAGRVVAGLGRRDVSADAGLPVPRWVRAGDQPPIPADPGWRAVSINDQHLILEISATARLAVGDLIGFGISHPCTTFDKWRSLTLVDENYHSTATVRTTF